MQIIREMQIKITKSANTYKFGWGCEEKETQVQGWRTVNWCSHCGKPYGGFSTVLKRTIVCVPPCPTLCDPTDCSPPGPSVHGISQARMLEWVAIPFYRGSSWPRDWTHIYCISGNFFTTEPPRKLRTVIWSSSSTLGIRPVKMNSLIWKGTCTPMFISALFTIAEIQKQCKYLSVHECLKKMWHVCVYTPPPPQEILLSHKKEWNCAIYNMYGPRGYYA